MEIHSYMYQKSINLSSPIVLYLRFLLGNHRQELTIGRYVAELIPDYATIQVGLGKIADSVLLSLKSKKGLGIHSGSITDTVMELIDLGVVTNEQKDLILIKQYVQL